MQLDILDAAAIAVSVGVLLFALIFVAVIWAGALGHPVF